MKELLGDVFVSGQLSPAQMRTLAEQGVKGVINNRPDMEVLAQPLSSDFQSIAQDLKLDYHHIPMARDFTPDLIEASVTTYKNMPRPIVAFCASGTRSAALWAFAHVKQLGVDGVLDSVSAVGYNLEQLRGALSDYAEDTRG